MLVALKSIIFSFILLRIKEASFTHRLEGTFKRLQKADKKSD